MTHANLNAVQPSRERDTVSAEAHGAHVRDEERAGAIRASFFGPPMRFVDVDHSRLAYRRFGSGPDLVLVHGWPLHSATFRTILPMLAEHFTCHLLDMPGTGQTQTGSEAPLDLVSQAKTMRTALYRLELSSYALLAHDSGAVVARLMAAEDERVMALVISGSEMPGHRPWMVELYAGVARMPGGQTLLTTLMRPQAVQRSFLGFRGCFSDVRRLEGDFRELFVEPLLRSKQVASGQMGLLRNLDFSLVDRLDEIHARIQVPTLMLWGADDPFFPVTKARQALHQFAGGAELEVLPNAKLFVHEEHPEEFARRSCRFLQRHAVPRKPAVTGDGEDKHA